MVRKEEHSRSYSSIMAELIRDGYIPKDSKDIPLKFINKEILKIKEKKSDLPASIRIFFAGMAMIDTIKKEQDAKKAQDVMAEAKPAEEIVMAGAK
jgi:hypothetical protein